MRRYIPILALLLSLCIVTIVTVQLTIAAPLHAPIMIDDRQAVQGVWGDEGTAAWSTGAATVTTDRHRWVDWRQVGVTLQSPSNSTQLTTLRIRTHTYTLHVGPTARRMLLLDRVADGAGQLGIDSETQKVAGDRRALGVRIGDIRITRLAQHTPRIAWTVLLWLLPLYAAAAWMIRRGWVGLAAWAAFSVLHMMLLATELARGYAGPTLLLVSPWRELWSILMLILALWPARPSTPAALSGRRIGLDVLRSVAVLCVVVAHGLPLLFTEWNSEPLIFRWFVTAGDVGVDIFFALSGFLIGAILLRQLPQMTQWDAVRRFWARRWLRTLPAAYVSAVVVWLIAAPRDVAGFLRSIAFVATVNPYHVPTELGFWWSLGAEEAFYLLAPLVLLVVLRRLRPIPAFVTTLVSIALAAFVARSVMVLVLPPDIAGNTSYAIYARLDSMMWGVLIALIRSERTSWYAWLRAYGAPVGLLIGMTGIMLLLDAPRWLTMSLIAGHMATTIGAALLIPALEQWTTLGGRRRDALVRGMALISYSVYLYHSMWEQRLHLWFGSAVDWSTWGRNVVLYLVGTILLAMASYRWVEKPFLAWRDTHYKE